MIAEHLFPRYHVRPPKGYMNDPNGPILIDGLVHLYFQYRHTLDYASPVSWGHVTSTDFVNWVYHRPAITPHPLLGDRDGCWSGNTVVDDAGLVRAFYSGYITGEPLQSTQSAVSSDGGFSFGTPRQILDLPADGEQIHVFRDPFVWRQGTGWRMVVGAGTSTGTAMVRLYESDDLDNWAYVGPLAKLPRKATPDWDSGEMWECPQMLDLDGTPVAVVGSWTWKDGIINVLAFTAPDRSGDPDVEAPTLHLVDHGPNFYAPSALRDSPHGPLLWGWATEGRSRDWCETDGWSGMLSLPRVVRVGSDGGVSSAPLPALSRLRVEQTGRRLSQTVEGLGAQFEFELTRVLDVDGDATCALRLRFGEGEYLEVTVDYAAGWVSIDRNHASSDPRADKGVFTITDLQELRSSTETIRGFIDGSILELFIPGGHVTTIRFYPTCPPPWGLDQIGADGIAEVRVWKLNGSSAEPEACLEATETADTTTPAVAV